MLGLFVDVGKGTRKGFACMYVYETINTKIM